MFEALSDKLSGVFDRLRQRGALSETDIGDALREVPVALLDTDVALPVVRDFIAVARDRALGSEVLSFVTPGQQIVKTGPQAPPLVPLQPILISCYQHTNWSDDGPVARTQPG